MQAGHPQLSHPSRSPPCASPQWRSWALLLLLAREVGPQQAAPPLAPTRLDGLGDAKVDELQLPLHHQEVGGLQVGVHDALVMDGVHRLGVGEHEAIKGWMNHKWCPLPEGGGAMEQECRAFKRSAPPVGDMDWFHPQPALV